MENIIIGLFKASGGSVYGILAIPQDSHRAALLGNLGEGGKVILRQSCETRSDFKARAKKEFGVPMDSPIWGKVNPPTE